MFQTYTYNIFLAQIQGPYHGDNRRTHVTEHVLELDDKYQRHREMPHTETAHQL